MVTFSCQAVTLLYCQFIYVFKPQFVFDYLARVFYVIVTLLDCQFNYVFNPQFVLLSGTSVLCNRDVFMSAGMECFVARLDHQFSYVCKPQLVLDCLARGFYTFV